MERLKQDRLTRCFGQRRQWRRSIPLAVILLALVGQVTAQVNTNRVADLINQLKSPNVTDRQNAAIALGKMEVEAKAAVPALIEALKDSDEKVRSFVVSALGEMGVEAKAAVPRLIEALKDCNKDVRRSAAYALGRMGVEAKSAAPGLLEALKDSNEEVRRDAASALGEMGAEAKAAVPALIEALKDSDASVRINVVFTLGRLGPEAVPGLIEALKDSDASVRRSAASGLWAMGREAKAAVPGLIEALKDSDADVRRRAAVALGRIGPEEAAAVPVLTEALKDSNEEVRHDAADTLSSIAKALADTRSTESLPQLKTAYRVMQDYPELKDSAADVKRTIDYFEALWWVKLWKSVEWLARDYPFISLAVAAYLILQIVWLFFFWLSPLLLLKVSILLGQVGEKFKIPKLDIPIPIKFLVFPVFHYRLRLLDAWVRFHLPTTRENFAKQQTVKQRKVYVAMPAEIDEEDCDSLSAESFQPFLNKSKLTILLAGEGGAGKTSLACQMALWAMENDPDKRLCKAHRLLPVLVESNLESRTDGKNSLVETVRGQLRELAGLTEPIPEELFDKLLRKRRVLVILDSLSELDETTHKSVRPAQSDFPIAALVVTSRIDEDLGGAAKTTVRPLRLKSNRLSNFIDKYLTRRDKRELFEDDEFFDDCRRLSQIVGEREITVLIAKLYADQMIATKKQTADSQMPGNLPDLMQGYVKNLNDQVKAGKLDTGVVLKAAKIIAAQCLAQTYRPSPARIADVLAAPGTETDARAMLTYLEDRLQIIQTTGAIGDRIRFSLDPLAEYLTGLYMVENYKNQEDRWRGFMDMARTQPGAPETIKGFLLAVRDCCVDKGDEYGVPEGVKDGLARLAGLDPEAVNAAHLKQRIKRLITNLKLPDAEDRATAAEMLGKIGPEAKDAVPMLIEALKDSDAGIRSHAADALGKIGPEAVSALTDTLKSSNEFLRYGAAEALGKIGPEAKAAVPLLIELLKDNTASARSSAAAALGRIGPEARAAVPLLSDALADDNESVRSSAAEALGEIGPEAKVAIPILIEALKDSGIYVRRNAASALGAMGEEARAAVPMLIEVLKDSDEEARSRAAAALGKLGPEAKAAVSALTVALKDDDEAVRNCAAAALGRIGPEARAAIPVLIETLKDSDIDVRRSAAEALGTMDLEAVPALIETLKDNDKNVRVLAAYALGQIRRDAQSSVPALIEALRNGDDPIRSTAATALGNIGPEAVPGLSEALKDGDTNVRRHAAAALLQIGSEAKAAVPALSEALKDHDESVRTRAMNTLEQIGPDAIPGLIAALKNRYASIRINAALALEKIGLKAKTAVPALIETLGDSNEYVRFSAAKALGKMGPKAKAAVPALTEALMDSNESVRHIAKKALQQIEPEAMRERP